jgi:glycosyltransferase involved in cell wall biosynthesis
MRVLHLPFNIASQAAITVRALRTLGVEARGLVRNIAPIQEHSGIYTMDWFGRPNPVSRLIRGIKWRFRLARALAWADVIHWHWGNTTWKELDLRLAAMLRKPRLVEFWGDDLRNPELASRDNPYIARMYQANPELAVGRSHTAQQMFHRHGFACLIPGYELSDYLEPGCFPGYYQTRQRLLLEDFAPRYPDPANERPILVHAPSHKARKGTEAVMSAVEKLAQTHSFNFKLIHQVPRRESLEIVAGCDVFLDQFTIGAEGLASLEAMALGKPVVCFVKPAIRSRYPGSLPIVSTDQDGLAEAVAGLLKDGQRRHALGVQGRQYIEQYYDARKLAAELLEIYQDLAESGVKGSTVGSSQSWRSLTPALV